LQRRGRAAANLDFLAKFADIPNAALHCAFAVPWRASNPFCIEIYV